MLNISAIVVAAIISVFAFIAVAVWADNRRREREVFHRNQTYQKMLEHPGETADAVFTFIREREDQRRNDKAQEKTMGLKLGGLITTVVGVGFTVFLFAIIEDDVPVYLVGLIPLGVGLVLSYFGFVMVPNGGDDLRGDEQLRPKR